MRDKKHLAISLKNVREQFFKLKERLEKSIENGSILQVQPIQKKTTYTKV